MSAKAVLQRAAFFIGNRRRGTEAQARAGAKIKRIGQERYGNCEEGRAKTEARACAARQLSTFPRTSGQSGGTRKQRPDASPSVKRDTGLARGKSPCRSKARGERYPFGSGVCCGVVEPQATRTEQAAFGAQIHHELDARDLWKSLIPPAYDFFCMSQEMTCFFIGARLLISKDY